MAAARAVVDGRAPEPARSDELPLADLVQMPRLGDTVIELSDVSDGYGDDLLFDHVDLGLEPGERLGVVGVNGSGKSTLLDLLAGRRTPGRATSGWGRRCGSATTTSAGSTSRPTPACASWSPGPTRQPDWTDAALLERLWFGTDTQWAPVRLLSGGERRRLQLALVLRQGPNVLLLDEPTNDLDLDTLRALEDLLDAWPGTLVVVSHDRAFLERTVEDVVVLEHVGAGVEPVRNGGDGGAPRGPTTGPVRVGRLPGGYAAYEAGRRAARVSGRVGPVTPRAVATSADGPSAPAARGERGPSTRSPSTLRHLMRRADADMLRLHERQSALEAELAAAQGDHVALARVGEDLSAVAGELAAVEESWLALAEEAEGQGLTEPDDLTNLMTGRPDARVDGSGRPGHATASSLGAWTSGTAVRPGASLRRRSAGGPTARRRS